MTRVKDRYMVAPFKLYKKSALLIGVVKALSCFYVEPLILAEVETFTLIVTPRSYLINR